MDERTTDVPPLQYIFTCLTVGFGRQHTKPNCRPLIDDNYFYCQILLWIHSPVARGSATLRQFYDIIRRQPRLVDP